MFLFKIKSEYISELFSQRRSRLLRWSFSEFVKVSENKWKRSTRGSRTDVCKVRPSPRF